MGDEMFDGPEGAEHKHETGHQWVDFVIAGTALLVSVVSLTVAVLHGRTMEQMADANARLVQANSWPFITTILSREAKAVTIGIRNSGVGPAKIHWVQVRYGGKQMRSTPELMAACCGYVAGSRGSEGQLNYSYSVADNTVLRAGDLTGYLTVRRTQNPGVFNALYRNVLGISLSTCYCSVFEECFIGDGQSLDLKPVKTCPAPEQPFNPQP